MGAWSALYFVSFATCLVFNPTFRAMDRKKKADYVGRYISIVHALIVSYVAFIGTFSYWYVYHFYKLTCLNSDDSTQTVMSSQHCLNNPKQLHEGMTLLTCGYFTFDFIVTLFLM